jgi:hypothetical protein
MPCGTLIGITATWVFDILTVCALPEKSLIVGPVTDDLPSVHFDGMPLEPPVLIVKSVDAEALDAPFDAVRLTVPAAVGVTVQVALEPVQAPLHE